MSWMVKRAHARLGVATLWAVVCGAGLACSASSSNSAGDGGAGPTGAGGAGSCEQTIRTGSTSLRQCIDYGGLTGDQSATIRMACTSNQDAGAVGTVTASYRPGACDRAGAVGGCRFGVGSFMQTIWYFDAGPGFDAMTWRQVCAMANGTWVTP